MSKIVCFGEALIDMLAAPRADPQAPRAFLQFAGGAPANVAVAAARLGADSHFAGMLGQDMFGDFLHDSFVEAGVATDCIVRTHAAKTALAFVALDAHGERSFSFYRPPAADLLFGEADFAEACFAGTGAFHVCSNSMTEPAIAATTLAGMRRAASAGALVSMDLNLRPALWPLGVDPLPTLWEALCLADLVKLSREELAYLAAPLGAEGEAAVRERLFAGRARLLVVTDGGGPLRWYAAHAQGEVPGFEVTVRDTTAAGDAFVAGLLVHIGVRGGHGAGFGAFVADRDAIEAAVRYGAAVGALAVTRHGAFAAMPSAEEVSHLLRNTHAHA
ncbi:carbohydrate kinase [Stenotrophomonas sp. HITSZ_GD]|uniref:carbohydrate kinase family protein n=1 Tax=Stenotrophomonas sp. HITSZ_GD TaxID=3037248 RepID=UPI00240E4348|nr:carbohydrate kinase [Stenotrophomonas sp. HITSZ_GD]MDG2524288.1 carbohydrate kinase [Stenotrophomonas sp. HITSZ_GD]